MAPTLTKKETNYRLATVKGERCGTCSMFRKWHGGTCTLVKGIISAPCVCDRWDPKKEVASEREAA